MFNVPLAKWLAAFGMCLFSSSFCVQAQHPSCQATVIADEFKLNLLKCGQGAYTLPTNFNVSHLEGNTVIQALELSGLGNVGMDQLVPLPRLVSLMQVELHHFNQNRQTRFPLARFLTNNRGQLKTLTLFMVKLLSLSAVDLDGFHRLESLRITNGGLQAIAADTFTTLGQLTPNSIVPTYQSKLRMLRIFNNPQLVTLDWGFLAPVAGSLKELIVLQNGLETDKVSRSVNFSFTQLIHFEFASNRRLISIPLTVLDTLAEINPATLKGFFGNNNFCENNPLNDCSCCELAPMAQWMRDHFMTTANIHLNCGRGAFESFPPAFVLLSVFSDKSLHQHCPVPVPEEPEPVPTSRPCLPVIPAEPVTRSPFTPPIIATCVTGVFTKPSVNLDLVEASRFELKGDHSRKCSAIAYDLHTWLLEKADLGTAAFRRTDAGVVATCRGAGELTVNESDQDSVVSGNIVLDAAYTRKCRDIFHEFLEYVLRIR